MGKGIEPASMKSGVQLKVPLTDKSLEITSELLAWREVAQPSHLSVPRPLSEG